MGSVIKDFYKSDAPQFKGRSKEKRREMAIAAKLEAERGPQNEGMSPKEIMLQKKKAMIDQKIARDRKKQLNKAEPAAPTKAMGEGLSVDDQMKISRDAAKGRNPNPDHKAIRGKMLRKPLPKDTRTDAQKMTDATGPRPGSRYRGD